MNGTFQKHERGPVDEPSKREAGRHGKIVDDQTVETSHTLFAVRTTRGIPRCARSGIYDVVHHGTTRGYPAGIAATGAIRVEK